MQRKRLLRHSWKKWSKRDCIRWMKSRKKRRSLKSWLKTKTSMDHRQIKILWRLNFVVFLVYSNVWWNKCPLCTQVRNLAYAGHLKEVLSYWFKFFGFSGWLNCCLLDITKNLMNTNVSYLNMKMPNKGKLQFWILYIFIAVWCHLSFDKFISYVKNVEYFHFNLLLIQTI